MTTEYEAKILDIDCREVELRLLELGAEMAGAALQRRYVYDIVPGDASRWIRLRTNGSKTTLAVKVIHHDGIDGVDEEEIVVDDFERTHRLLQLQGFTAKAYQENLRSSYRLDGAEVEIDEWPMIPPYLEIEGQTRGHVVRTAGKLGFGVSELTAENTTAVYARYGIDLSAITELRF